MTLRLHALPFLAAALALAPLAVAQTDPPPLRNTDFVALGGGANFVAFASPQLITRDGSARITASLIFVVDPMPANGQLTIQTVEWIWCADGVSQTTTQISRNAAGVEVSTTDSKTPGGKPGAGTIDADFLAFVCTGKLPNPQAARYATIEEAIPGARAILARSRTAAAPPAR